VAARGPSGTVRLTAGRVASIRAAAGTGKLRRFSGLAYTGAPMRPDGWHHPIVIDLDGLKIPSQHRPVLRQHDHEQVVGHTTSVRVTREGIPVEGVFSGEPHHVAKVTHPADNGFEWQMSIGANPIRTTELAEGETITVNGREVTGPMTIARETELGELSFVPLGADGGTSARISAGAPRVKAPGRGEGCVLGVANEYLRISSRLGNTPESEALNHCYRGIMRPGCFDHWLARVSAGKEEVLFCVSHDTKNPLCSTRDGSLSIWSDPADLTLCFAVLPTSAAGRRAIQTARDLRQYRKVSVGWGPYEYDGGYDFEGELDDPKTVVRFSRVRLREISIVVRAAFPGTFARVY
jgi:phage head maturation protease